MKETSFIKQNNEKWKEYEKVLEQEDQNPDKLKDIFIEVTDDLSYSRTFYPNRSVRVYLNGVAQTIFQGIYTNKKSERNRLKTFWTDELPKLIHESRSSFRLSLAVFALSVAIGVISSAIDIEFSRIILGDSYVDMTIENIESGDPMKVYKDSGRFGMAMGITLHNIMVSFLVFITGIFYAIGTIGVMIQNGIMLGAFQYFFYEKGVFLESVLTIWIHGTFEISAIIIAGAAGITMGKGLVFPGTLSRIKSFQISAKRGLKIMLGIIPIFVFAGFFEGFLTRMTEIPDAIRAMFILINLAIILFYFVWYPYKKSKTGYKIDYKTNKLPPDKNFKTSFFKIKSAGEIFKDSFRFFAKNIKALMLFCILNALLYTIVIVFLYGIDVNSVFYFRNDLLTKIAEIPQFIFNKNYTTLFFFNTLLFSLLTFLVYTKLYRKEKETRALSWEQKNITSNLWTFVKVYIITGVLLFLITFDHGIVPFVCLFAFPILLYWNYDTFNGEENITKCLVNAFTFIANGFGKALGLSLSLFLISIYFYTITNTQVFRLLFEMIAMNVNLEQAQLDTFVTSMTIFFSYLIMNLLFVLMLIGFSFLYYSQRETFEAISLNEKIQNIGVKNRIRGIEKEV